MHEAVRGLIDKYSVDSGMLLDLVPIPDLASIIKDYVALLDHCRDSFLRDVKMRIDSYPVGRGRALVFCQVRGLMMDEHLGFTWHELYSILGTHLYG